MTATDLFWAYFEPICTATPGVQHVSLSDGDRMERLTAASVSEPIYPALFVLRPRYRVIDNGASQFYAVFEVSFFVFCQSDPSDWTSQDAAFAEAETIGLAVIHRLRQDHLRTARVDFEYGSVVMEPVTMLLLDSSQGYEVKCKLALEASAIFS
jgi:hypothetical protein